MIIPWIIFWTSINVLFNCVPRSRIQNNSFVKLFGCTVLLVFCLGGGCLYVLKECTLRWMLRAGSNMIIPHWLIRAMDWVSPLEIVWTTPVKCRNQIGPLVGARVLTFRLHQRRRTYFLYWHQNKHIYTVLVMNLAILIYTRIGIPFMTSKPLKEPSATVPYPSS